MKNKALDINFIMTADDTHDVYDKNTSEKVGWVTREFLFQSYIDYTYKHNTTDKKVRAAFKKWVNAKNAPKKLISSHKDVDIPM